MSFEFTQEESAQIIQHFGRTFYEKVVRDIQTYSDIWNLEISQMVNYYSVNCIFLCRAQQFGDAILKIGNPNIETYTEYNTLREYAGKRFCKVFDADIENGIILEEQIKPGIRLRDEKLLPQRLSVFSELFNGLHIPPANSTTYPTYFGWVCHITEYMSGRKDHEELYAYMKSARDICTSLCATYSKNLLLHGDLHHDNILLEDDGKYKIIDPKGVVGDPIFDISRFIVNEFYGNDDFSYEDFRDHVHQVIGYFEKSLHVPAEIIKKCLFIETAMGSCWSVEDNDVPDMNSVTYAHALMNG